MNPTAAAVERRIATNGTELHVRIEGRLDDDHAPWVTLSHSLAADSSMWDGQAAVLAPHCRVLRIDTRGHGHSAVPPGPYTLEQMAEDVHGVLEALGIARTHFIGLSMGGMIGQAYALAHPGRLISLVLADTTARRPPNAAQMWAERIGVAQAQGMEPLVASTLARWFTEAFRANRLHAVTAIGEGIRRTPAVGFAACAAAIARVDFLDRLHEIDCPVLIVVGDQDHGTPPEMSRQIHARLPASRLVVIESAAHLSNIEQPAVFNQLLLDFLNLPQPH